MATGATYATGCTSRITAKPCAWCSLRASPARPTTSAAKANARTTKWCRRCAPCWTRRGRGKRARTPISTPQDTPRYQDLLGDGRRWGLQLNYAVQPKPGGIAQALLIAREFIGGGRVALILGDNIFYGHEMNTLVKPAMERERGATVFGYPVKDPERYGVVEFDQHGTAKSIEEKPKQPRSRYAVTGFYFLDSRAVQIAERLKPSAP